MALRLSIRGKIKSPLLGKAHNPEKLLKRVIKWMIEHPTFHVEGLPPEPYQHGESAHLQISLHPAAEPLELETDGMYLIARASTTSAGPGFHHRICEALDELATEFNISWQAPDDEYSDETGYFHDRDLQSLEYQMLDWCTALAKWAAENRGAVDGHALCMPLDPQFTTPCFARTCLGPRTQAWLRTASTDLEVARSFFPWWEQGETAAGLINTALIFMWCDVCWAPAEVPTDIVTMERVSQLLYRAYQLDPDSAIPWKNWNELVGLDPETELDEQIINLVKTKARTATDTPIGYRRSPVNRTCGSWSFTHPGEFYEHPGDDGDVIFGRGPRFIRFTSLSVEGEDSLDAEEFFSDQTAPPGSPLPPIQTRTEDGVLLGRASDSESDVDEEPGYYITGAKAKLGRRMIVTIGYPDAASRQWAIDTWMSFK